MIRTLAALLVVAAVVSCGRYGPPVRSERGPDSERAKEQLEQADERDEWERRR